MAISKIFKTVGKSADDIFLAAKKAGSKVVKLGSNVAAGTSKVAKTSAKAFPVKTATKVLGGTAIVAGAAGITKVGFDWTQDIRGLVGLTTPKEDADSILDQKARNQEIDAARLAAEKDYISFLTDQGLADTPNMRNIFDEWYGGSGSTGSNQPETGTPWLAYALVGGGIIAGLIAINNVTKKSNTGKK